MNHASVIRILAAIGLAFGGLHVVPILGALIYGETTNVAVFLVTLIGLTLASSLVLVSFSKPTRRSHQLDGLAVVVLCWTVLPIVASIPFAFSTNHNNYIEALHEAVSCLTTSGHSVLTLEEPWTVSMIIYRGVLHLFGGLLSLVTVATVFATINFKDLGIRITELLRVSEDSFFDSVPKVILLVLSIFSIFTFVLFLLIWFSSGQMGVALSDAISVSTTGWVNPERTIPSNSIHQSILIVGLILSTIGLTFLFHVRDRKFGDIFREEEVLTFILLLVFFSILAIFAGSNLWSAVAWATTSLSTSGIEIARSPVIEGNYIALWLVPALIGGSALSTAGGIKLVRLFLLGKIVLLEFQHGADPHSSETLNFKNKPLSEDVKIGISVYVIGYFAVTTAIALGVAFSGQEYSRALTGAVGAISNSGFLIQWSTGEGVNLFGHLLLIIGQILGRLEVLALIPVLSLEFWRR